MRILDLLAVVLFLAGMAGMGVWFARKNTSTEAYFLGNRSFPGWAIGISMLGTSISSVTFLAIPAAAYVLDYRQAVTNLALPFVAVIALIFFIPLFRQGNMTSAFEYLEKRYGVLIRSYAALSFLVLQVVRLAMILYLVSIPIEGMLGIPILWIIIVGGVVVSLYTVFGGIEAVVWTDVVQTFILLGGGLLCLGLMVWDLPGGFGQVIEIGTEFNKFSLGPMRGGFNERTFFAVLLLGLVNFTNEYASNQNVVQRYIASKSLREARKATLICIVMSLPTWIFFFFIGSCLFAYFKVFPSAEVAAMKPDDVLPHFILTEIWPGVGGVIIAACLAAAMSSLSSSINAVSTIWTIDFLRLMRRKGNDRFELVNAKLASGAAGIIMIAGAWGISLIPRESVYDLSAILGALLCSAGLTPFMLGFFTTRIGNRAILSGMYAALVFSVYNILNYFKLLPEPLQWNIHIYMAGPVCNGVMLAAALAYSLFRPEPVTEQLRGLTVWTLDSPGQAD